MYSSILLC